MKSEILISLILVMSDIFVTVFPDFRDTLEIFINELYNFRFLKRVKFEDNINHTPYFT